MKRASRDISALSGRKLLLVTLVTALLVFIVYIFSARIIPHQGSAVDTDASGWDKPAVIVINNTDTTSLRDMSLFVRCGNRFVSDTLTVRIAVSTPDSLHYQEPVLLNITPGRSAAAVMPAADIAYRRRVCLSRTGDYHITITPTRKIKGIEAVGINIAASEQQ